MGERKPNTVKTENVTWKSIWKDLGTDGLANSIATIVIFVIVLAIAAFIDWACIAYYNSYFKADYKQTVEATLVNKTKYVQERERFDSKEWKKSGGNAFNKDSPRFKRTEKERMYRLEWEYYIDGEKHELVTKKPFICLRKVGSKKTFRVYSHDGAEYDALRVSLLSVGAIILCSAVSLLMICCILRVIYGMIVSAVKKKSVV
jgi:hypothetical protein